MTSGLAPGMTAFNALPPNQQAQQQLQNQQQQEALHVMQQYAHLCKCAGCTTPKTKEEALETVRKAASSEITAHELAHASKAGRFGGAPVYEYNSDGIMIAGHVPISIPGLNPNNPQETLFAAQTIRDAALAPGDPSGADRAIAFMAQGLMGQAKVLMDQQKLASKAGQPSTNPAFTSGGKPQPAASAGSPQAEGKPRFSAQA